MKLNGFFNICALVSIVAFSNVTNAGYLVDKFDEVTPESCKEICKPWSSSMGTCVEQLGQHIGATIDPVTGTLDVVGDKFGTYLCVCSTGTINASAECLKCVSQVLCLEEKPLIVEDYSNICYGKESIANLVKTRKETAKCA